MSFNKTNRMSIKYSDSELVTGLLNQDDTIIDQIYREIGPKVKQYIVTAGGTKNDADDIFQEGIIATYINLRTKKYTLDSNTKFSTYLTQVCKYKWYDVLKSSNRATSKNELIEYTADDDIEQQLIQNEKYTIIHEMIEQLGEKCRDILNRYYWMKESIEEISKKMKMVPASVKNGKYRCMKQLKEMALQNKNLRE